jgi:phage tail sheath protein FI
VAISPTYPGVYIEEIPSAVHTIAGVSTSVTAFVGYTPRGKTNSAIQIFSYADYERAFGGLNADSPVSYAVQQFFLNGGTEAWIVRVASGAARAAVSLLNASMAAQPVLTLKAASEGIWGNNLRVDIDYVTVDSQNLFNLTITEYQLQGTTLVPAGSETYRNLSMNSTAPNYAVSAINGSSKLIWAERPAGATALVVGAGVSTGGGIDVNTFDFTQLNNNSSFMVTINGRGPTLISLSGTPAGANGTARLTALANDIAQQVNNTLGTPSITAATNVVQGTVRQMTFTTVLNADEKAALHFSSAGQNDVARLLSLGSANGGTEVEAASTMRPAETGTVGIALDSSLPVGGVAALNQPNPAVHVQVLAGAGAAAIDEFDLALWAGASPPGTKVELANRLQQALRGAAASHPVSGDRLSTARAWLGNDQLRLIGGGASDTRFHFTNAGPDATATSIGLVAAGVSENVARYALGVGPTVRAQTGAVLGNDGAPPGTGDITGDLSAKSGIYALEDVDIFNLLCIPGQSDNAVITSGIAYCENRRAFYIVDMPSAKARSLADGQSWIDDPNTPKSPNAAAYFPWLQLPDPLQQYRLGVFPPSGTLAGLYARTDATRGVWKAPAGTEAVLRGPQGLTYKLTDPENGTLNPLALNAIRSFPVYGYVSWGARTLVGSDQAGSEWKYIPVRRLALYIEESLYRGTKWAVFEPNDEPLWAQIRLNVGAFMHNLFRQGAFEGASPRQAYLVKCDSETTTQNDIDLGIVNILVGFAPLKPAEFVFIRISQLAGQVEV